MKIFVTGASGYVGSAVTRELLAAGHQVVGLARSEQSANALISAGAEVHRGELDDLDSLTRGAVAADGVIHLAYMHDFSNIARGGAADLLAVKTFATALKNTNKPFVGTSGTLMVASPGKVATEEDTGPEGMRRVDVEEEIMLMAKNGVRSSLVRLSPTVHGDADKHGFVPSLIGIAREKGISAYIGDGSNHWPAVHYTDAARLFRLAIESASPGTRFHGVGEEGIPFKEIAQVIGDQLKLPVVSVSSEEANDHFGFLGQLVSLDNLTSSALTQKWLGWQPEGIKLIDDLKLGHYFES